MRKAIIMIDYIKKILWEIMPRIYPCRDVIWIRWRDKEFIIKKRNIL
jgi:hypothetical protein